MNAHYSSLPRPPSPSLDLPPQEYDPFNKIWEDNGANALRTRFGIWASTLWTLAAHFALSVGITIFILAYVEGHYFNVTERTPSVQIIGGTQTVPFVPLQSDIVTALSALIAVLKCVLGAWAGSLCWHIALFLMEKREFTCRDLTTLLRYGLLAPGTYSRNWWTWIAGALLLVSFAANVSSAILTGSIAWVPTSRLVHELSIPPVAFPGIEGISRAFYTSSDDVQNSYAISAMNDIGVGWGRAPERGVFKRVAREAEILSINSTIENITLPYFEVHSIRWVENRDEIPSLKNGPDPATMLRRSINLGSIQGIKINTLLGVPVLMPNNPTNWLSNSSHSIDSTIVRETRLLGIMIGTTGTNYTQDLPINAHEEVYGGERFLFAWVEFTAGIGRCREYSCVISSSSTLQNSTQTEVEPHLMTSEALVMAPGIGVYLVYQNTSIPYMWSSINDYVEAILVRSYSGSWMALNTRISSFRSRPLTRYVPALPSLLAHVDRTRVYIWLGLQLLVTILSILFLIARSNHSRYPLMGNTALTGFYLDTTEVPGDVATPSKHMGLLTVEPQGDRFKVKLE